eukprot:9600563-Alexandrium_andersonii.AAC.1
MMREGRRREPHAGNCWEPLENAGRTAPLRRYAEAGAACSCAPAAVPVLKGGRRPHGHPCGPFWAILERLQTRGD